MKNTQICYILAYYQPNYIRTKTLLKALKYLGINPLLAINSHKGIWRYLQTCLKLIYIRLKYNPNVYILGFRGHEIYWLVRLITWKKYLIFDNMMSPYDALKNEKKAGKLGEYIAPLFYILEKSILKSADRILTDTHLHSQFFAQLFTINSHKFKKIYVGADEITITKKTQDNERLEVIFYGSFLPLHGSDIILKAIKLLIDEPIHFTLIGGKNSIQNTPNLSYIKWVDFDSLITDYLAPADICLGGAFGGTAQAQRVITGKTFQGLAMAKTTIIGHIDENVGFIDKVNCLLIQQNNVDALVKALLWANNNRTKLNKIGKCGQHLYNKKFSTACIAKQLQEVLP